MEQTWQPKSKQRIHEWALENLHVTGAEAGPLDFRRTPYAIEILDEMQDPKNDFVVWSAGAQVSKTTVLLAALLYFVIEEQAPALLCMSTISLAEGFSKERLSKVIANSPKLLEAFGDPKARSATNTIRYKEALGGGFLYTIGANSTADMRSRPLRVCALDEVSSYPPNPEGDAVDLIGQRQATFFNALRWLFSTPVLAGDRIDGELAKTDFRRRFLKCPNCGHWQYLRWQQFRWPNGECYYYCESCDHPWSDGDRHEAVKNGEWRPTRTPDKGYERVPGFHLPGLYSPWESNNGLMKAWLAAQGDPLKLQTFINTKLGEGYRMSEVNELDWEALRNRAENYEMGTVPMGAMVLTAGVDVQRDRLVVVVDGWGPGFERWSILHIEIDGNPLDLEGEDSPWQDLLSLIQTPFKHESGKDITVSLTNIDSGNDTETVYKFVETHEKAVKVRAVKGLRGSGDVVVPVTYPRLNKKGKRKRRGIGLWGIGVSKAKKMIYSRLKQVSPGPGYHHFGNLSETFYKELTGEELVQKVVKGYTTEEWRLKRGRQNHALDCCVYSMAAAFHLRMNAINYPWRKLRAIYSVSDDGDEAIAQPSQESSRSSRKPSKGARKRRSRPTNPVTGKPVGRWLK